MSASAVIRVKAHFQTDRDLNPVDKLVLLHWAWGSRDGEAPAVIRFKRYARELGLSVNGVKKAVGHLIQLGYFEAVAVQVRVTAKLRGDHTVTPKAETRGDHSVTPVGSPSDPQRDHPVTPFKEKEVKKGPPAVSLDFEKMTAWRLNALITGSETLGLPRGSQALADAQAAADLWQRQQTDRRLAAAGGEVLRNGASE